MVLVVRREDLAAGGDTANSDEYLFDEDNDYTLDFVVVEMW